jgi:DNA-binding transcriptional MerR regulator
MEMIWLTAAEVQHRTGATRKALRIYEEQGLITRPQRTHAGWRQYAPRTLEEVRFIRAAMAAGLRLDDLKPALEAWRRGNSACPTLTEAVQRRAVELEAQIQELVKQRDRLRGMLQALDCGCPPGASVCPQITNGLAVAR